MTIKLKLLLSVPLICALSACGFHLRGSQSDAGSSIETLYLQVNGNSSVAGEVQAQLQVAGTRFTDNGADADYSLYLANERLDRTVLSVSANSGKAEEYQLTLGVQMSVLDHSGKELLSNQLISISRDYNYDENAVLGNMAEEKVLVEELTRRIANQVIRQLNAVSSD